MQHVGSVCQIISLIVGFFLSAWFNLSLQRTQAGRFSINSSICQPQSRRNMLHKAHRLSIFDLRCAHAFHITLLGHFDFLLYVQFKIDTLLAQCFEKKNIFTPKIPQWMSVTFEILKQKADILEFAFSASTKRSPLSSSRKRYRPVVMWRIRKDCPHLMWLPLQLQKSTQAHTWATLTVSVNALYWCTDRGAYPIRKGSSLHRDRAWLHTAPPS